MTIKEVKQMPNGELFIEFTDEEMAEVGWKPGDSILWTDNGDGSWTMSKKDTEWVLVDCVQSFRIRYCVEVPAGKAEWALDTVVMEEAKEFSQKSLGENIISHRIITKQEALALAREENDYVGPWSDEDVEDAFLTPETDSEET